MHDLKILELAKLRTLPPRTLIYCQKPYEAFCANIANIAGYSAIPGWVYWTAMTWMESSEHAKQEIIGKHKIPHRPETRTQIGLRAEEIMFQKMSVPDDVARKYLTESTVMFQHFLRHSPYMHGVMHSLINSVCIQSWGTFEAMFKALFWAIEEMHPIQKGAKTNFARLEVTRKSYELMFNNDPAIMSAINGEHITALSKLRNVLIHRAGHVDSEFQTACNDLTPLLRFKGLAQKQEIKLDGELIISLVEPSLSSAVSLFNSVEEWMTKNH